MILLLKSSKPCEFDSTTMKTTAANSHGVWKFASRFSVDSHHFSASKQWILGHSLAAMQPVSKFPAFWSTAFFSCSIHCLTLTSLQNPSSSPLSLEKSQQFKRHDWFTQKSLRKCSEHSRCYIFNAYKNLRDPHQWPLNLLKGQLNKGTLKRCLVFQGTCGDKSVELVVKFEPNSRNT